MYNVWSFFTHKSRFGVILIIALTVMGVFAMYDIPKESSPEVDVPLAVISTALPGASPEEVETLVTNVLESPLQSRLENVNEITSQSSEGVSTITIEFNANADIDDSVRSVRNEVETLKGDLPDDATDPRVLQIDFADQPVVTATLAATIPQELLYQIGEELEEELESVRGVSSVTTGGIESREVTVVIDHDALVQRGLTVSDVTRAIAAANVATPLGSIEVDQAQFPVRLSGDITDTATIGDIAILSVGGSPVYVRDVARVVDGRAESTTLSRSSIDGEPSIDSISFEVYKASGAKITDVSTNVRERLTELQQQGELLDGMQVLVEFDAGEELKTELQTLSGSGVQTVLLVTLVLALAVGWREALIAAISIPLSFLVAFIGLYYSGNTINFVSLFALILSIGIIVDSTIVVVEAINRRLRTMQRTTDEDEHAREQKKAGAALGAVREFHIPLTAGTMTTVAVFAPLFLVSGITGEFIASIPFTIIFVLSASLLVALGFVPLFATRLLRRGEHGDNVVSRMRDTYIHRVEEWYRGKLRLFLESRELQNILFVTLSVLFVLSLALPVVGAVRVVFFEDSDADYIFVETELPVGTVLSATDLEVRKAEEILYGIPEVASFVTTVGSGSAYADPTSGAASGERFGNIFITLRDDRDRTSVEVVNAIRQQLQGITTSTMRVDQLSDGPPSAAPIGVTLSSESLEDLDRAALVVEDILIGIEGTTEVTSSTKGSTNEFVFTINRPEMVAQGVSTTQIAQTLRATLFGEDTTEIKKLGDDIQIVARLAVSDVPDSRPFDTNATTIDALKQIEVTTAAGNRVPLGTFVTTHVEQSRATIRHKGGERIATLSAAVAEGGNALVIAGELQEQLDTAVLPDGVSISIGGESEDVDQSFQDMFVALGLGLISMFGILVLQFNSFRYATYVLMIVPLALIGVFAGLMLTGSPLSFPSMMGFIALSGIVVNNSIILIDTINSVRRNATADQSIADIVVQGSTSRLRPVVLTALTTVVGIMPLLFAAAIWVPLAYAIMFGLAFSTIITLLLVPAIYARWPGTLN